MDECGLLWLQDLRQSYGAGGPGDPEGSCPDDDRGWGLADPAEYEVVISPAVLKDIEPRLGRRGFQWGLLR